MAHSNIVIDHYDHPRNVGSMPKDDPNVGTGVLGAPECGDAMKLQMKINPETRVIEEAKFKTFGCGSAIASSSLATEWVKRKRWPSRTRISSTARCWPRMPSRPPSATGRRRGASKPATNVPQPCPMRQDTPELGGG